MWQLWEALEQRLDSELRKKSSNAAVHAMSQEPAAATKDDEDRCAPTTPC